VKRIFAHGRAEEGDPALKKLLHDLPARRTESIRRTRSYMQLQQFSASGKIRKSAEKHANSMTKSDPATFGSYIASARKRIPLSQKQLAERILREEDGQPISPQYLNDIERDRRSPTSDHLIQQFANVLKIDADYLNYLAGKLPEEIRAKNLSEEAVRAAFTAFRKQPKK
jgi:transcriptional regulator with XRE-family HTH domain